MGSKSGLSNLSQGPGEAAPASRPQFSPLLNGNPRQTPSFQQRVVRPGAWLSGVAVVTLPKDLASRPFGAQDAAALSAAPDGALVRHLGSLPGVFPSPSSRAVALRPRPGPSSAACASAERPRVGNGGAGGGEAAEPGVALIPASRGGSGGVRRRRRRAGGSGGGAASARRHGRGGSGRRGGEARERGGRGLAGPTAGPPHRPAPRGPSLSLCPQTSSGLARSLVPESTSRSAQLIPPLRTPPAFSLRTSRRVAQIRTHRPRHPSS